MTLEELRKSGHIIFECISGSKSYGLNTPSSDTDIRGVFVLPKKTYYSLNYIAQINDEKNDVVYYELNKFVALCIANNPNILELLNVPKECILQSHPLFDQLNLNLFLSKKCEKTFANYAFTQIKKARRLEKKIVNPMEKERKQVLDFCLVLKNGKSSSLIDFLEENNLKQEDCGLSKISKMKNCYNLYSGEKDQFKGIVQNDSSNEVSLSNIPKGLAPISMLFFNQEGYSSYCKKYREYWDWVEKRNDTRYESTIQHGKNYDAKNMMHTFRLLRMAKEIALKSELNVYREDREFLLNIKQGKFEYEDLVEQAETLKNELNLLFTKSDLPDSPNESKVNQVLLEIRQEFYDSF